MRLALSIAVVCAAVSAAPVNYVEGADLNNQTFNLDVGNNVFSGTILTPSDPVDQWFIRVDTTQEITSIRWQYSNTNQGFSNNVQNLLESFLGDGTVLSHTVPIGSSFDITNGPFNITTPTLPLPGGGLGSDNYQARIIGNFMFPAADWTVTFTVGNVGGGPGPGPAPEPSALLLLVAGAAVILRKRA